MDDTTQMGPLVSAEQHQKVLGYIQEGKKAGAKAAAGGEKTGNKGYFVKPTVLVDTSDDMSVVREEIFGPVVCAIPFKVQPFALPFLSLMMKTCACGRMHVFTVALKQSFTLLTYFKDGDDLIRRANDTPFGLASAVWTKDVSKAHTIAKQLRAGTVWVNCYNIFDASLPFGGYKESGWGREMGPEVFELYTQTKSIVIKTK